MDLQTLENEAMAWQKRFPQYEYRPQDDCVALRKRRQEAGFTRLELWLHPDDHEAVKEAAAKLQRKRES